MTKPKKPPVLPEIRFPSDAETALQTVGALRERGGRAVLVLSRVLCVHVRIPRLQRRCRPRPRLFTPIAVARRDAYSPVDGTAGTTPRRTRRRGTSRPNIFQRPRARRASRRPRSGLARRRRKPSARRTGAGSPRRRRRRRAGAHGRAVAHRDHARGAVAPAPGAEAGGLGPARGDARGGTPRRDAPAVQPHERRRHGRALRPLGRM